MAIAYAQKLKVVLSDEGKLNVDCGFSRGCSTIKAGINDETETL